ncbi:hypothetical protein [Streptomyces sp. NPDC089919]|uniref:anti-sigma factor family protein n=1 Tax=Streptomyces sp. NPDC089919 TaxID=3155188 RepID=UPI0034153440
MSSTTGTIRHPEVSEISDLTEGLLSPAKSTEVRLHLTECPLCADVLASLEEIRGLLGTLPGPHRMPADIAGRIDAALAAEALLDATSPEGRDRDRSDTDHAPAADVSRETSTPRTAPRPQAPGSTRPAGRSGAGSGPGRTRSRRRFAVLTGMAAAAALSLTVFLVQNLPSGDMDTKQSAVSAADSPGPGFTSERLATDVQRLLTADDTDKSAPKASNVPGAETYRDASGLSAAAAVPTCVTEATGRSEPPLAGEPGTYQGQRAFLVVFPNPGDGSRVDAYVVDAGCTSGNPAGRGSVLLTGSYPRS